MAEPQAARTSGEYLRGVATPPMVPRTTYEAVTYQTQKPVKETKFRTVKVPKPIEYEEKEIPYEEVRYEVETHTVQVPRQTMVPQTNLETRCTRGHTLQNESFGPIWKCDVCSSSCDSNQTLDILVNRDTVWLSRGNLLPVRWVVKTTLPEKIKNGQV